MYNWIETAEGREKELKEKNRAEEKNLKDKNEAEEKKLENERLEKEKELRDLPKADPELQLSIFRLLKRKIEPKSVCILCLCR